MAETHADRLNPRAYVRSCIDQRHRDVEELRRRGECESGDRRRLAHAERERTVAEAELPSVGTDPGLTSA